MRVLVVIALVAGCGSDVDLTGVYRVDVSVESSPCGVDQPTMMPPAFLKFSREEFFGQDYFAYEECTDATATDCSGPGLLGGFPEPIDDGWKSLASFSSGTDGHCLLGITEKSALLHGEALVVEDHEYRDDNLDLPQSQCEPEEAEKRRDDLPCIMHTRIDATRL
jgi:hypothetical protein